MKLRNHNKRVEKKYHLPLTYERLSDWASQIAQGLMAAYCGKSQVTPQRIAEAYIGHVKNGSICGIGTPTDTITAICDYFLFGNDSDEEFLEETLSLTQAILKELPMEVPEWIFEFASN